MYIIIRATNRRYLIAKPRIGGKMHTVVAECRNENAALELFTLLNKW